MSPFVMDLPPQVAQTPIPAIITPAAAPASTMYTITSASFGVLEVPDITLMTFAQPLLGFPDDRLFTLLPAARDGLWWMLSASNPSLTFLLADPFLTDPAYVLDIGESDERTLGLASPQQALALVLVAFPTTTTEPVTANFRAPIIFNLATRAALQVVSRDESHDMRRPIDLRAYAPQDDGLRID